ncbi:MAG: DUF4124 domain-containing protein [Lysobacterales bacterium]
MKYWPILTLGVCSMLGIPSAKAEIYKCTGDDGSVVFSDSPCATDAEVVKIESTETGGGNLAEQDPRYALHGSWRTGIHTYNFRPGGRFRNEQHYGGELIVWRTGTWTLKDQRLTLKYTQSGGQLGAGKMNFSEGGKVRWAEDWQSFETRLDGDERTFSRK